VPDEGGPRNQPRPYPASRSDLANQRGTPCTTPPRRHMTSCPS
jgi:hypothetical protein